MSLESQNSSFVYENQEYGFKIRYPKTWLKEELNQQNEGYATVVVFRSPIKSESEPPSVTIYINDINSKGKSFEDYVTKEIEDVVNDNNLSLIDISDVIIANRHGIKLVDVENQGYKRMVHWISSNGLVFELSYESNQSEYQEHLVDVETMINSFELDSPAVGIEMETKLLEPDKSDNQEDPLVILKIRFAKGEINEEEFKRMRSMLEG